MRLVYSVMQQYRKFWITCHSKKLVHRDVLPFSLPVTPDGWVMVPKQVTPEISNAINVVGQRCTCGNCSQRLWDLLLDATQQGVNRG